MKKILLLIMISVILSLCSFTPAFGEIEVRDSKIMWYSDSIVYINGMPLPLYDDASSYSIADGKIKSYDYYVLARDLERCGFTVNLDEEAAVLSIKRILGKKSNRLSEEEYHEQLKKIKDNANGEIIHAGHSNLTVTFDGIPWRNGGDYYLNGDCFIPVDKLANLYGSQRYERPKKELYLTISYDHPVARTVYSAYAYPLPQSFEDYWIEKAGKYEPLIMSIDDGEIKHFENPGAEGSSYHASYMPIELIIEKYELKYKFTENALVLYNGQSLQKDAAMKDAIHANAEEENRYQYIIPDWEKKSTFACVDLKLFSGGKEYTEERDFPIFISIDGKIYMDIGVLANALKE